MTYSASYEVEGERLAQTEGALYSEVGPILVVLIFGFFAVYLDQKWSRDCF